MSPRVLIVGHGTAGRALGADVKRRGGTVVGYLDDRDTSPEVLGTLADINEVIDRAGVEVVYFAIPSVDAAAVRNFVNLVRSDSVEIAIVPRTYAILTKETVDIDDLTDVDVLDLVGREPVKHDLLSSRAFIAGKKVLVTGAAGSIGSRLVQQLVGMQPAEVVCVDWWENGMFFLGQELSDQRAVSFRIADVKNEPLMDRILAEVQPDIVFHAAAYKHVPLMQDNPLEAITNNVWGSLNILRLAQKHDVANVVYVSTDKAVNPVNVMGATKRLGEMILEILSTGGGKTRFNAVRFGNVIQSNGSVMQIFRGQIANGRPLTVTHPDVTRFFMTVDEASQLIIQSALIGNESEIFVLDMGEPVKIMDLARSLIKVVDPSLTIEITGLRPGEKMYEELSYEPDKVERTGNQKIFVVRDAVVNDPETTLREIEALVDDARAYRIGPAEAIERLRGFGFPIK
ncbi:polysaccharide biosynthesis protein [Leifsonia poae]|uniref:polysaccharide biosynthesis protein n=1 Tax=Leifsonia poae TaxID=110933 RepID=UPI003D66A5AC